MSAWDLAIVALLAASVLVAVLAARGVGWARWLLAPVLGLFALVGGGRVVAGASRRRGRAEAGAAVGDAVLDKAEVQLEERLAARRARAEADLAAARAEEAEAQAEVDDLERADSRGLLLRFKDRRRRK